ncbi:MAG: MarR family transcriptional regulator [Anaerolineae bacterium]|nr:MarR family transcriptional regulator [Anaerolineae bacterium]
MAELSKLVGLLTHVQQTVTKEAEDALKPYNLSQAKYNILYELYHAGGRLPFSVLVERIGCVRSNITGLVDRLQEDNLVRRVDHPEDRRMLFAELTEEGCRLITAAMPCYNTAIEQVFSGLNADQQTQLADLLLRLQD